MCVEPFCTANLLKTSNKLSDDAVGTNSRWLLRVAAQVDKNIVFICFFI